MELKIRKSAERPPAEIEYNEVARRTHIPTQCREKERTFDMKHDHTWVWNPVNRNGIAILN